MGEAAAARGAGIAAAIAGRIEAARLGMSAVMPMSPEASCGMQSL